MEDEEDEEEKDEEEEEEQQDVEEEEDEDDEDWGSGPLLPAERNERIKVESICNALRFLQAWWGEADRAEGESKEKAKNGGEEEQREDYREIENIEQIKP